MVFTGNAARVSLISSELPGGVGSDDDLEDIGRSCGGCKTADAKDTAIVEKQGHLFTRSLQELSDASSRCQRNGFRQGRRNNEVLVPWSYAEDPSGRSSSLISPRRDVVEGVKCRGEIGELLGPVKTSSAELLCGRANHLLVAPPNVA